jgi:hypothetical protein
MARSSTSAAADASVAQMIGTPGRPAPGRFVIAPGP